MGVVKDPDNNPNRLLVQMMNQYQGALLRACYLYLCDMEQAKDAVQETFLKAYKALPSFKGDCSEKTWLFKIAINTCREMRRSRWFRYVDRRITPEQIPGVFYMDVDDYIEITKEIMKLSPKLKEVIILYYWKGMTMSDISSVLGISQSTVTSRLKRAREKLQEMLERSGYHG